MYYKCELYYDLGNKVIVVSLLFDRILLVVDQYSWKIYLFLLLFDNRNKVNIENIRVGLLEIVFQVKKKVLKIIE